MDEEFTLNSFREKTWENKTRLEEEQKMKDKKKVEDMINKIKKLMKIARNNGEFTLSLTSNNIEITPQVSKYFTDL